MNIVRLVNILGREREHSLTFMARRCLHDSDRHQDCSACLEVCPAGALTKTGGPAGTPAFSGEACQQCLACLATCPGGAFTAEDETGVLLQYGAALQGKQIELLCHRHNDNGLGPAGSSAALRLDYCLATLGLGTLLFLAAAGFESIIIRSDSCGQCPWQGPAGRLVEQVNRARHLLHLWPQAAGLNLSGPPQPTWQPRPLQLAGSPPVSRRALFRLELPAEEDSRLPDSQRPFHERLRLAAAVQQLGAPDPAAIDEPLPGMDLAIVNLSGICNACGACGRICPTGALKLAVSDSSYSLTFAPQACIGCRACTHACPNNALTIDRRPTFRQIFAQPAPRLLQQGAVSRCRRCRAPFPAVEGKIYCDLCLFRIENPFGSGRPPGQKQAEDSLREILA